MTPPLGEVLGSRVFALDGPAPRALLISDLHVPADGGEALVNLTAALAAARRQAARLFVLGDLFDSYVARGQARRGVWAEVAARFQAATAAGTRIDLLLGNRDFLLGDEFVRRSGVRLVDGGLRGEIGGVDSLLLHGDELCLADLPYQRAKRWLRHGLTRWLARRLPVGVALRVAERARQRSRMVIQRGDQTRFLPTPAAFAAVLATGVDRLFFGHVHRHAHDVAHGRWYGLPAFDAGAVGYWLHDGRVESVRCASAAGELVSLPAPGALEEAP